MHKSENMETINYIFIVPPDDYNDQCHSCLSLLKEGMLPSSIREAHNQCHDWTHCDIYCCGPCPYCGYAFDPDDEEERWVEDEEMDVKMDKV